MPAHRRSSKQRPPLTSSQPAQGHASGRALAERLRFETFLLGLSAAFARAPAETVARQIDTWLGKLAAMIRVDRCTLWELAPDGNQVRLLHLFSRPGLASPNVNTPAQQMGWLTEQYRRGNIVVWARVPKDIPAIATGERAWAQAVGAKSALCIPLRAGAIIRSIVFVSVRGHRKWPVELIKRLRLVGEIFSSAITREAADASLQSSEARTRAILEVLPDLMFVMSPEGVYLDHHSNDDSDLLIPPERFLGRRVEEVLPPQLASRFQAAIERVSRSGGLAEIHYSLPILGECREYEARMVRRDDGAIVSVVRNVTERTRAQHEIERLRLELTHFGRNALMGELTSSLAHELMQPLAAASANAEACRNLLADHPDCTESRAILADIVMNCRRAAGAIERVRGLLTKERKPRQVVEVNRLVQGVADVMHNDLAQRQVQLMMQLDPVPPEIHADPIELQQVILNLLLNGAEAVSHRMPAERELTITTAHKAGEVELTVRDRGNGADPAHLHRMFDPFFTTKPGGMGLGLTICSGIVRAHGGKLWAENNASGGVTVYCRLPRAG